MDTSWERAIAQVQGQRIGTGVVVDRDACLLLTCAHVVGDRTQVQVRFPGHDTVLPADVVENWAPDLDAALLQVTNALPEGVTVAPLGLEVVAGHRFRSRGYHYAGDGAPLPIEGEIRGLSELGDQPAIILSSEEVAEGMSGAPLVDADTGLVIGLIRRYHEQERWLVCGIPLSIIADRWPRLRELTVEARYRDLLRTAYGFWERRFTPLEMTAQERVQSSETRRGWIPPSFSALEEQMVRKDQEETPSFRRVPLPGGLSEALDRYQAVVLLGEPGAGKSTALAHLAGQLATDPDRIPVLVSLHRYEQDEKPVDFLRRTWSLALQDDLGDAVKFGEAKRVALHEVGETVSPLAVLLEHLLDQGRLVLLLDSLNEMPGLAAGDPRLSSLAAFVDRVRARDNRIVVACRVLDYAALRRPLERSLQQITLEPLDNARIHAFLCAYLGIEKSEELIRWLGEPEQRAVHELCQMPFFLRLVAYLCEREGKPPTRRVDLLDRYVYVAIKREQARLKQDWPPMLLVEPLSELALQMQEQGTLEIWENEARRYATGFPEGRAGAALRIAEGAGLLRAVVIADSRGVRLRFVHQLWQQDLAARALVRRTAEDGDTLFEAVQSHLLDERWTEVVALAVARLKDATRVVECLLETSADDRVRQRPLFCAAAALAEGAQVANKSRQRTIDRLLHLAQTRRWRHWWEKREGGERASATDAWNALSRLEWDEYVTGRLRALVRNRKVSSEIRVLAAWALELAEDLVDFVRDMEKSKTGFLVRVWAIQGLRGLCRSEDLRILAEDRTIDPRLRAHAAHALGELGYVDEAAHFLVVIARSSDAWETIDALGKLGRAEEILMLARDSLPHGFYAAQVLSDLGRADCLLQLARSETAHKVVRVMAIRTLVGLGKEDGILALVLDDDTDFTVRLEAAETLGELGRADGLLTLARDNAMSFGGRWLATVSLTGQLERKGIALTPGLLAELLALARDTETPDWIRITILQALKRLGSTDDLQR